MIDNHLYDIKRKLPKYVDLGGGRNYYVHLEGREDFLGVEGLLWRTRVVQDTAL